MSDDNATRASIPSELMQEAFDAYHALGGQASNEDHVEEVANRLGLSPEQRAILHQGRGPQTELAYRLGWARTYLKLGGYLERLERASWALTTQGQATTVLDLEQVRRIAREVLHGAQDTFLFVWNPKRSAGLAQHEHSTTKPLMTRWACGRKSDLPIGSRVFMIRVGVEPKGIVAAGYTLSEVEQEPHWDAQRAARGERANFVKLQLDHASIEPRITREELALEPFHETHWDIQSSGMRLQPEIARALEALWAQRIGAIDDDPRADDEVIAAPDRYTIDDAVSEMFISREEIEAHLSALKHKKNIVFQGPPGVGKTFLAKRFAWLLQGSRDDARIDHVQLHQSQSYEDFIQGYRPAAGGQFERVDGPFLRLCERAKLEPDVRFVFLIDEINRGNLSRIFGELLMLIEADKRDPQWALSLTYGRGDEARFYVPPNVYLIGTMNTADRSLAMVDYALRRRFAFITLRPGFKTPALQAAMRGLDLSDAMCARINARMTNLNAQLASDPALGEGFCIGHSFFCARPPDEDEGRWYDRVVRTELEPLLREYYFDQPDRADAAVAALLA